MNFGYTFHYYGYIIAGEKMTRTTKTIIILTFSEETIVVDLEYYLSVYFISEVPLPHSTYCILQRSAGTLQPRPDLHDIMMVLSVTII